MLHELENHGIESSIPPVKAWALFSPDSEFVGNGFSSELHGCSTMASGRPPGEPLKVRHVISALMSALLLSACQPTVNSPLKVGSRVDRIVSLSPGITETLFEMGFGPRVVGVSRFDHFPPATENLPRVGGYLDPNWEAIIRLHPDLILVMESQEAVRVRAERFGLRCCRVDQHDLKAMLASFENIAAACGNAEVGKSLRARVEARLQSISGRVRGFPKPRTLVVVGRNPKQEVQNAWVAAPGSLCDDLLSRAGGVNVITDSSHGPYPEISREGILDLDPDVILDLMSPNSRPAVSPQVLLRDWKSMTPLRARREKKIFILQESWLVIPGPRVVRSLEVFAKTLHPGLS